MRRETSVLLGCVCGIALAAVEGTVVGTAMPTIVGDLGGFARYNWAFAVYLVVAAVTMPIWGKLSDLHGARRYYVAGVVFFLSGSALAGLAPHMTAFIAARAVQGLGAGAMFSIPMTILGHSTTPERRGHIMGIAAGTWGVAALLGPPIGALVIAVLDWRWIFYLNIPVGLVGVWLVLRNYQVPEIHTRHRLDVPGAILVMALALSVLLAAQAARERAAYLGLDYVGWLVLAVILLPMLVMVERRATEPIVPLRLARHGVYRVANLGAFFMAFCVFNALTYMPLLTTLLDPSDVARAGMSLIPASLGWTIGALASGRLVVRVGARRLAVTGALVSTIGFLAATQVTPTAPLWQIMPTLFPIGLGIGITSPPFLVTLQNRMGDEHMGTVTSGLAFFRHLGGTLGITALGLMIPISADPARVAAGIQHIFMAAAGVTLLTALLATRMPASALPEPEPAPEAVAMGGPSGPVLPDAEPAAKLAPSRPGPR